MSKITRHCMFSELSANGELQSHRLHLLKECPWMITEQSLEVKEQSLSNMERGRRESENLSKKQFVHSQKCGSLVKHSKIAKNIFMPIYII